MKQVRHNFSAGDYSKAVQDYDQNWKTVDRTLYQLCTDHPLHQDRSAVTAKVVIIGRSYATGIERKVSTTGTQGSSISQVVALLFSHGEEIDEWLVRLGRLAEPLATPNIPEILTVHGLMVKLLSGLTIESESARSFVAKYLHFHNPIVPIYDSVASGFLPKLVRLQGISIPASEHADRTYAEYVCRFAKLYDSATKQAVAVTVRLLDYYLVWKKENSQAPMLPAQVQLGSPLPSIYGNN